MLYVDADKIKQCIVCGYEDYSELKPKKNRLGEKEKDTWLN